MIKADIFFDDKGMITGYKIRGHAGSVKKGEFDWICNSVSILTQAPINGLTEHLKRNPSFSTSDGRLELALDSAPDDLTQAILMTMYYGLKVFEEDYPRYVQVKEHGGESNV